MELKNAELHKNQQLLHYNREEIGTELYFAIEPIEPLLASKITGMMLQWDTQKVRQLLHDKRQLIAMVKQAKSALENVPFKSHMMLYEAEALRVSHKIDYRDILGKYVHAIILQKQGSLLLIHCDGASSIMDQWSDYEKELHRFAVHGSISYRPAHRLQQLVVGDMVDINRMYIFVDNM